MPLGEARSWGPTFAFNVMGKGLKYASPTWQKRTCVVPTLNAGRHVGALVGALRRKRGAAWQVSLAEQLASNLESVFSSNAAEIRHSQTPLVEVSSVIYNFSWRLVIYPYLKQLTPSNVNIVIDNLVICTGHRQLLRICFVYFEHRCRVFKLLPSPL
uniref:Uncharacterized protein n=1 Tax=Oryza brachyantha TaxID=4533 RepID=J3NE47_ORYBR